MPESLAVRCVRRFQADAERVFRAWTIPALITRWWSPDADTSVEVLTWDLVPGGRWRFAYTLPDKTCGPSADFAEVGQAVRSMPDTGFGRCRTAAGCWG